MRIRDIFIPRNGLLCVTISLAFCNPRSGKSSRRSTRTRSSRFLIPRELNRSSCEPSTSCQVHASAAVRDAVTFDLRGPMFGERFTWSLSPATASPVFLAFRLANASRNVPPREFHAVIVIVFEDPAPSLSLSLSLSLAFIIAINSKTRDRESVREARMRPEAGKKRRVFVTFSWPTYKLLHWSSVDLARFTDTPIRLQFREGASLLASRPAFHFVPPRCTRVRYEVLKRDLRRVTDKFSRKFTLLR